MRTLLVVPAVGLVAALLGGPPAAGQRGPEWTDLLGRNLKDWTRMGTGKNPWRLTGDRVLTCAPATDAYAPDTDFADGTIKFEYRFQPTGKDTGYKASVTARWTRATPGCTVDLGDDCGTICGRFVAASDTSKELKIPAAVKAGREPGEWNYVKLVMHDTSVKVNINGREVGSFDRCMSSHGIVMFSAEGSEVEFRNIQWRPAK